MAVGRRLRGCTFRPRRLRRPPHHSSSRRNLRLVGVPISSSRARRLLLSAGTRTATGSASCVSTPLRHVPTSPRAQMLATPSARASLCSFGRKYLFSTCASDKAGRASLSVSIAFAFIWLRRTLSSTPAVTCASAPAAPPSSSRTASPHPTAGGRQLQLLMLLLLRLAPPLAPLAAAGTAVRHRLPPAAAEEVLEFGESRKKGLLLLQAWQEEPGSLLRRAPRISPPPPPPLASLRQHRQLLQVSLKPRSGGRGAISWLWRRRAWHQGRAGGLPLQRLRRADWRRQLPGASTPPAGSAAARPLLQR